MCITIAFNSKTMKRTVLQENILVIVNVNYLLVNVDKTNNLLLQEIKKNHFHISTPLVVIG